MSATLFRGQAIRRRADLQRITVEPQPRTFLARLGYAIGRGLLWLTIWTVRAAGLTGWGLVYVPPLGALALVLLVALLLGGPWSLMVTAVAGAAGCWSWDHWWPGSWDRWVASRVLRFARRIRYRFTWDDVLAASGVKVTDAAHRIVVPRLLWVHLGQHADVLVVQLCPGVTPDTIAEAAEYLVSEWGALEVRVQRHPKRRGWALIRVVIRDVLAETTADQNRDDVDLNRLPLGRREDGKPWTLRLAGRHMLVAGSSGAGKGSIVTSLLGALAPAIRSGRVRVIGIDPKGGMEFGMYPELFGMFAWQSEDELVRALEEAAARCIERCKRLKGKTRLHHPTADDPYVFVIIDEIASLTAYIVDKALKDRAKAALAQLLTKGRAPGYSVIGLVQDPRKEVVELRNLFTVKIGLRLDSKGEVAMVLGDEAHDRGAHCEVISLDTPGVGYVVDDEDGKRPVKVRADYRSDAQMRWLAAEYGCADPEDVPTPREPAESKPTGSKRTGGKGKPAGTVEEVPW